MPKSSKARTASKRRNNNRAATANITEPESSSLPDPLNISGPRTRPIRCYAFDPSQRRFFGNEMTLHVKYEKLVPGPIGDRIAVIDYDGANKTFYKPVDLDAPDLLMSHGR